MSYFETESIGFYLQDAYVKNWIDNTMVFMEVADVDSFWDALQTLNLTSKYENIKLFPILNHDWGRESFAHDP